MNKPNNIVVTDDLVKLREVYANPCRCGLDNAVVVSLIDEVLSLKAKMERQSVPEWKALPDSQGDWWHWDGHPYTFPFIYGVLVSNTGGPRYFIQHPDSRWCDEVGGIWCKINPQRMPTRKEFKSILSAQRKGKHE